MMRSTFKLLFYINHQKIRSDGTAAVFCRISIDGKNSVLATGVSCHPEALSDKNSPAGRQLSEFRLRVENAYKDTLSRQGVISAEILKNALTGIYALPCSLLSAGEEEIGRIRAKSTHPDSSSPYRTAKVIHRILRSFILSQGVDDIPLSGVTKEFAESYRLFLKKEKGYSPAYINRCLCWVSRLLYIAVERGLLRHNPLEGFAYEKAAEPKLLHISRQELIRIMSIPIPSQPLELARRLFIFSCFTGLAYVDVVALTPGHIAQTSTNRMYIRKARAKTEVESFIPLHPIAWQILSLYNTTRMDLPVFPPHYRSTIRHAINLIGFAAGIKQSLSFHQARHSFATLCLSAGVPIESVSKMMGHTNITSTQIYAKVTQRKISEDMDRLMERRSKQMDMQPPAGQDAQE